MNQTEMTSYELFKNYPDIMTVQQAREALGVGRPGIYQLIRSGALRCFKIGNAYKIPKTALIDYIQRSSKGGV